MNNKREKKSIAEGNQENRRMILWLLCGGYLLYLAFKLGQGIFTGDVKTGTESIVAWSGCIAFAVIGAALLFMSARMGLRSFKESLAAVDEEEEEALPEGVEALPEGAEETPDGPEEETEEE